MAMTWQDFFESFGEAQVAKKYGFDWRQKLAQLEGDQELNKAQVESARASAARTRSATALDETQHAELLQKIEQGKARRSEIAKLVSEGKLPSSELDVAEYLSKRDLDALNKRKAEAAIGLDEAQAGYYRRGGANRGNAVSPMAVFDPSGGGLILLDRKTGQPLQGGYGPAPTADMRNKEAARGFVGKSIGAIEQLSQKVITKVGPGQRAQALVRGWDAVMGQDPEYRVYQDARMALAGNLAVAQQGSRPSDADIRAIWLPMVPNVFTDTTESAAMKWQLIRIMQNQAGGTGEGVGLQPGQPAPNLGGNNPGAAPDPAIFDSLFGQRRN